MNALKKQVGIAVVLVAGMLACGVASAAVVMGFDEMTNATNGEMADNFYNGGCGGAYNGGPTDCNGPNYGVAWNGALIGGAPNGLANNAANEPSGPNVMFFLDSNNAYMDIAAGFDTGFSFYYSSAGNPGSITVYSGLDGTGSLLATLDLPGTASYCDGSHAYSCWMPIGVTFAGIAQSVSFAGSANYITFDNITVGSATPINGVPEPAALGMFGFGVLLLGLFAGMRRRVLQN